MFDYPLTTHLAVSLLPIVFSLTFPQVKISWAAVVTACCLLSTPSMVSLWKGAKKGLKR